MLLSLAEFMPQTFFVYSPRDLDAAKPFLGNQSILLWELSRYRFTPDLVPER